MSALALLCLSFGSCASEDIQKGNKDSQGPQHQVFYISTIESDADGTTRGIPSDDLEESAGIYAYTYEYDDAWDYGAGTAPDFMVNEEMQFAGSKWVTVNTFDKMPSERYVRYFAYYPYSIDPDVLEVTDEAHDNAPQLFYTVPDDVEEQLDLLAGGCIDDYGYTRVFWSDTQNGKDNATPEPVTLTMHHLLTAVKFQVGECVEAGRIKNITLTSILGRNKYSLHRDADDTRYEGWETHNLGEGDDTAFRPFSIDMNKQIRTTQRDKTTNEIIPQAVTDNSQWLLMIPQILSYDTKLIVTYNSGGVNHELETDLSNFAWPQGKLVTYTLNIKSLQRMTVNSTVIGWSTGITFNDGQPTNIDKLDMDHTVTDWDPSVDKSLATDERSNW